MLGRLGRAAPRAGPPAPVNKAPRSLPAIKPNDSPRDNMVHYARNAAARQRGQMDKPLEPEHTAHVAAVAESARVRWPLYAQDWACSVQMDSRIGCGSDGGRRVLWCLTTPI
jgi:hypothetical protein